MQVEKRMMVKQLGRPTPFTVRGIRYQGARKADYKLGRLHTRVFIADLQAEYLHYQTLGGTRTPQGRAIPVPSSTSMATYRVARAALRTCSSQKGVFQGTINGVQGIYRRPKRGRRNRGGHGSLGKSGLTLLVAYEPKTSYQPRYDFYGIGERSVRTSIGKEMDKAIGRALRSAK